MDFIGHFCQFDHIFIGRLIEICSSIIKVGCERVVFDDATQKKNEFERISDLPEEAIKEDIYSLCLGQYLNMIPNVNAYFGNNKRIDFEIDDVVGHCKLEVFSSNSSRKEYDHFEKFTKDKVDENWILHGVTVKDPNVDYKQYLNKSFRNVNVIYLFNDLKCNEKKIYFRFAWEYEYSALECISTPKDWVLGDESMKKMEKDILDIKQSMKKMQKTIEKMKKEDEPTTMSTNRTSDMTDIPELSNNTSTKRTHDEMEDIFKKSTHETINVKKWINFSKRKK